MIGSRRSPVTSLQAAEADNALLGRVMERPYFSPDVFPELSGGTQRVEVLPLQRRENSRLYRLPVHGKDAYTDVLTKVRGTGRTDGLVSVVGGRH